MVPGGRSAAALGDQRHRVLARLGGRLEHHDAFVGEQRRAEQFGELVGADLAGAQPVHRDVLGARLLAGGAQHVGDGAVDEQLFITQDEVQFRARGSRRRSCHAAPDGPRHQAHRGRRRPPSGPTCQRHSATAATPATATVTTPGHPDGSGHRRAGHRRRPRARRAAATTARDR